MSSQHIEEDILRTLYSEQELKAKIAELGKQISVDYYGKKLLLIGILKGCCVFMTDLMRCIDIRCQIDFMAVSSYGSGMKTSGVVKILKDLDHPIEGYDVLIVEDILDSGKTLSYVIEILKARNPNSVRICTLFDKPARRVAPVQASYVGFEVPDEFIVGYGLDYDEIYRNLPYIGVLKPELYR